MSSFPERSFGSLMEAAGQTANRFPRSDPEFDLDIRWASDYDALFANEGEITPEAEVLNRVSRRGRGVIVGRGGSGKTRMFYRLMRTALEAGWVPVFVDLKSWNPADYDSWRAWTAADLSSGAGFLLERFSDPKTDVLRLDALPPDRPKLLIVDGLNELVSAVGEQILVALDELARNVMGLSILVADRWTRRELPSPNRWALGAVQALSSDKIRRYVDVKEAHTRDVEALSTPYFLDAAIKKEALGSTRVDTLANYFVTHAKFDASEIAVVAAAAFSTYKKASSRTFERADFIREVGRDLVARLLEAGILVAGEGERLHFFHHLLHDFLAAKLVSGMTDEQWVAGVFEAITFGGSSFDTISMVFSLAAGRADSFLRAVYDWNPYAAAYALAESMSAAAAPSREMQNVIFAMLGEKQFDMVEPTSQQASDALALISSPDAAMYRDCSALSGVLELVHTVRSTQDWFGHWQRLFTLGARDAVSSVALLQIDAADSVIGWTIANVAKRITLSPEQQAALRGFAAVNNPTTKWRVAHVLGAWPSRESLNTLRELIAETNEAHVRYGALRSIIEIAARGWPDYTEQVLTLLRQNGKGIARSGRLVDEARRAMWIRRDRAPEAWLTLVRTVAALLYQFDESNEARASWQLYVEKSEIRYRNRGGSAALLT